MGAEGSGEKRTHGRRVDRGLLCCLALWPSMAACRPAPNTGLHTATLSAVGSEAGLSMAAFWLGQLTPVSSSSGFADLAWSLSHPRNSAGTSGGPSPQSLTVLLGQGCTRAVRELWTQSWHSATVVSVSLGQAQIRRDRKTHRFLMEMLQSPITEGANGVGEGRLPSVCLRSIKNCQEKVPVWGSSPPATLPLPVISASPRLDVASVTRLCPGPLGRDKALRQCRSWCQGSGPTVARGSALGNQVPGKRMYPGAR